MAKQIKAYVEVESYVDVSQGRAANPAALLSSVHFTESFGRALVSLAESATGAGAPARILSGPAGVGKSTALTLLYALVRQSEIRERMSNPLARTAVSYFSGGPFVPVYIDPLESGENDLGVALRDGFQAAAIRAAAAGIQADDWNAAAVSADPVGRALALIPSGARLILFVDGLASWLRGVERDAARRAVSLLAEIGKLAADMPLSVIVALDERALNEVNGVCTPLLASFQVEYLAGGALVELLDRGIFKKDPRQRMELNDLYGSLKKVIPAFRWSKEEFVASYPLHPSIFEVASALRHYDPNFSLPSFAATAANRAKGRRELSLVVMDEMFDQSEYEMRKVAQMREGFEIYDDFANNAIPKLADTQQRFWAKLVLKGMFLYSLAGHSASPAELAATMMLYDEKDTAAGGRTVGAIVSAFVDRASDRFIVEGEGDARGYRLPVAEENSGARVLFEVARTIMADDPRLADMLVGLGAARFPDWPAGLGQEPGSAEAELLWRGTWRRGAFRYRMPALMAEIPPIGPALPLVDLDALAALSENPLDLDEDLEPPLSDAVEDLGVTFEPAESVCELDWEIAIVPIGSPVVVGDGPPTAFSWVPGTPSDEDLSILRRLAAVRSGDPRLAAPGVDLEALRTEVEAEGGLVFHHLYLERGKFVGQSVELKADALAANETLVGLLASVLDPVLEARYPQHPAFPSEFDENSAQLLVAHFFVDGTQPPNLQQVAATLAEPLGLAECLDGAPCRFNPNSELLLSHAFNVEPLRLAEAAGDQGVPVAVVYQALRREPYGLQRLPQRLILAALIASSRLKLVGSAGELTAENLANAGDLEGYTTLVRTGLSVYANEVLLEWARLLTDAEHLNDLVTSDGRHLVRQALSDWLERWRELDVAHRFNEVPIEAATRRTWQLVSASKQYFDSTAKCIEAILHEEVSLEEGLGRIVTTFAANPTIYQRALRDLRMLTSFIDWVGFYTAAKEYILCADRTSEPKIEAGRTELLDYISAPHRLLDESKRRRFETVYETFLHDYVDYYTTAHDVHVGARADFEAIENFLDGEVWRRFQLLSRVRVANSYFYQLADELVRAIRDRSCELPTRELLHERPNCVCSFRLTNPESVPRLFERLQFVVEMGTSHHIATIGHYRQSILSGMRLLEADASYADASVPLIALLSGNDKKNDVTTSTVELINRCLVDYTPPTEVPGPPIGVGEAMTKEEVRKRLEQWLDELPGDDQSVIEISRLLPTSADE